MSTRSNINTKNRGVRKTSTRRKKTTGKSTMSTRRSNINTKNRIRKTESERKNNKNANVYFYDDQDNKTLEQKVNSDISIIKKEESVKDAKAKGILGERKARDEVFFGYITVKPFDKARYISIFHLFEFWKCEIEDIFRNESDHGIDDIFIAIIDEKLQNINNKDSQQLQIGKIEISDEYPPIFHESKFKDNGQLILSKNKKSCDQLSIKWIDDHTKVAQKKVSSSIELCFPGGERKSKVKIPSCNSCQEKIEKIIDLINKQVNSEHFERTASVLDRLGNIRFYLAE